MIVVDASVWVGILLPFDEFNAASEAWLATVSDGDEIFTAPVIVLPEVAGAITRRTRSVEIADRGRQFVERTVGTALVRVDHDLADLGLRGADAIYVALAERLGCPLVT